MMPDVQLPGHVGVATALRWHCDWSRLSTHAAQPLPSRSHITQQSVAVVTLRYVATDVDLMQVPGGRTVPPHAPPRALAMGRSTPSLTYAWLPDAATTGEMHIAIKQYIAVHTTYQRSRRPIFGFEHARGPRGEVSFPLLGNSELELGFCFMIDESPQNGIYKIILDGDRRAMHKVHRLLPNHITHTASL